MSERPQPPPGSEDHEAKRRARPFVVVAAVGAIVCLAILRLPDLFVTQLERNRPLTDAQAGWAYRLLAIAAVAQLAYGGFSLLRPERIRREREVDEKSARMSRQQVMDAVCRNAAFIVGLTLVYGVASFVVTGQRGGFWLFPLLALAQGAWYYRQTGEIARWLRFQPETGTTQRPAETGPARYLPPLARGLIPVERGRRAP